MSEWYIARTQSAPAGPRRRRRPSSVSLRDLLSGTRRSLDGSCTLTLTDYTDLILASGFPGMQHLSGPARTAQLDSYLARIADTDMEEAGLRVRRPNTVMAWLRAYAAATATTASWDKIRRAATPGTDNAPAKTTVLPYIDVLTRLRILDDLPAWLPTRSRIAALGMAPKHYLADPALAARLLGVKKDQLLDGKSESLSVGDGPFLGALFEALAVLRLRVYAQAAGARTFHLRTQGGRQEVDLIIVRDDGRVVAAEVKLASAVTDRDVRHLHWLRNQMGEELIDAVVVTSGEFAYRRSDGVGVVPLGLLSP